MEIIKDHNSNHYLNQTKSKTTTKNIKKLHNRSKVADYFDYIYSYPQKIKIKWDTLDELKEDLFVGSNSNNKALKSHFINSSFLNEAPTEATIQNYPISKYLDGFLNKINSSNFFLKKTKKIQTSLSTIPVFVILNGHNEIILNKPSNVLGSKTITNFVNEKVYDSCGAFDTFAEKKLEFGLFFMNYSDAEKYLKEVARSDFEGTQTLGLSIHCISLDSAYKVTREHHPGIDFRFVPNFDEVKDLLTKNLGKSDLIVEEGQQQLRLRGRNVNIFPSLKKLGDFVSPNSSFLQRNEYFKGVPIYIVQLTENPRNFWFEQYFNIVGMVDAIGSRCINYIDSIAGFGHNRIMEGSLQDAGNSNRFENYIFFEKDQAIQFTKDHGRKVSRFKGSYFKTFDSLVRKPKIFVYNLEDFLEDWEDKILGESLDNTNVIETLSKCQANHFVPPKFNSQDIDTFSANFKRNALTKFGQAANVKFRVLTRTVGVFFSI